jgi:hypothetical protein
MLLIPQESRIFIWSYFPLSAISFAFILLSNKQISMQKDAAAITKYSPKAIGARESNLYAYFGFSQHKSKELRHF